MAPPRRKKRKLSGKIDTDAEHLQATLRCEIPFSHYQGFIQGGGNQGFPPPPRILKLIK